MKVAEIDDHEHDAAGQGPVGPRALRRRAQSLGEDRHAEISEHPHQDRLRHHAADIGPGEQHHGTDERGKDASRAAPRLPTSSSRMAPLSERLPPAPPNTAAMMLAKPLVRNSLSRSADFCRATSRLDTSSSIEMAVMPHTAPISALTCGKHAPIDLVLHHRRDRPPQSELADAWQEPSAAHRRRHG